jgi:hypothetical protein
MRINLKIGLIADICGLMIGLLDQPHSIEIFDPKTKILKLLKSDCCCVMD